MRQLTHLRKLRWRNLDNPILPSCCSRTGGSMSFEKEDNIYVIYIGKGLSFSNANAPELFRDWLEKGELRFFGF